MKFNNNLFDNLFSINWSSTISLLSILSSLISCDTDKCPEKDTIDYFYLTVDEKGKIPYSGNDTLYFLDENKKEIVLIGRGKKVSYYEYSDLKELDCNALNIERHEINQFNFDSSNNSIFIEMKEQYELLYINSNGTKFQAFTGDISNNISKSFQKVYQFDTLTFQNVNILTGFDNSSQKLIINKELGIIQIKFSDTHYWLIKK